VVAVAHAELDGLFEASGEIETLCARMCALRAGPAERKRIELIHQSASQAASTGDDKVYSALNENLHQAIFQGAHNKTLRELAQTLRHRLAPFRSPMFFAADHRMASSHDEHGALVKAVLAQDADAAARAMREHAANSAINALQRLAQEADPGGTPIASAPELPTDAGTPKAVDA
jgi:DNA-binding GntR family transcriptional regulator